MLDKKSISCKQEIRPTGLTHSFDREIAIVCGLEAACIFTHICFWIEQNQMHGINQFEGRTWTYMTYEQISEKLGYLSLKQVRLGIAKLVEHGLIMKGDFSTDRFVKPTYYAVCDESIFRFSKNSSDVPKRADRAAQIDTSSCPPGQIEMPKRAALYNDKDIRKNTNIDNNTPPNPQKGEAVKAAKPAKAGRVCVDFGEFVKLTKEEHEELCNVHGIAVIAGIIEEMNDYCLASRPKGYSNYAAAIRQWLRKREDQVIKNQKARKFAPSSNQSIAQAKADAWMEGAI
jgi:hypothetical protein